MGGGVCVKIKLEMSVIGFYVGKLQVFWIVVWNLGLVWDRSDKVFMSFVKC